MADDRPEFQRTGTSPKLQSSPPPMDDANWCRSSYSGGITEVTLLCGLQNFQWA